MDLIGVASLLPLELGNLDQIAAGILEHRDLRGRYVRGRHRKLRPILLQLLEVRSQIGGEEVC